MKKIQSIKSVSMLLAAVLILAGCELQTNGRSGGTGIAVVSVSPQTTAGTSEESAATDEPEMTTSTGTVTAEEPEMSGTGESEATSGTPDVPDFTSEVTTEDTPAATEPEETTAEEKPVTTVPPETEPVITEPPVIKVRKITVSPEDKIVLGRPVRLVASVSPENASSARVTWSVTSGSSYGSVSADGVVSTYKSGKITVRATAADGSGVYGSYTFTPAAAALWSGKGTSASPYLIATAEDLYNLNYSVYYTGKYFRQTADIDLSGYETWLPIGLGRGEFANNYDGGGKKITNVKLGDSVTEYTSANTGYTGLFAKLGKCTVKNLTVEATGGSLKGYCGILCGCAENTTVSGCNVSGTLTAGGRYCGGLAGMLTGSVSDSSADVVIGGSAEYCGGIAGYLSGSAVRSSAHGSVSGKYMCGGFAGYVYGSSDIHSCFSTADVRATSPSASVSACDEPAVIDAFRPSGSFIGCLESAGSETSPVMFSVYGCYSSGSVDAECDEEYRRGFIGFVLDENTKNISVRGLKKSMYSDVKNNYTTDKAQATAEPREFVKSGDMSGMYVSGPVRIAGNITQEDLKKQAVFKGFDFSKVWKMGENGPELR